MSAGRLVSAVVLGGGVTGLAIAHRLLARGCGRIDVTVLEASQRCGGWIKSEFRDGALVEGGPRSLRTAGNGEATLKILHELNLLDEILPASTKSNVRFLMHGGKRVQLPSSFASAINNPFTIPMIMGVALEPLQHRRTTGVEDETLHVFFNRRFGPFFSDVLISAMSGGVWAGDSKKLSVNSCFPFLPEWERKHGSILLGALKEGLAKAFKSKPRMDPGVAAAREKLKGAHVYSFKSGVQTLSDALRDKVVKGGAEVRLGAKAVALRTSGGGAEVQLADGSIIHADHVFAGIDAWTLAPLLAEEDASLSHDLAAIRNSSLFVVSMAYPQDAMGKKLGGFGHLIPAGEKLKAIGVVYDSESFPGQHPPGIEKADASSAQLARLTVMAGGDRLGGMAFLEAHTDEEARDLAVSTVRDQLGVSQAPLWAQVERVESCIPQYEVGHRDTVQKIRARMSEGGAFSAAGASYDGVGVNDCIVSGQKAADAWLGNLILNRRI
mmetsp:Transcript_62413/g.142967  ORF Transcript_62413/g.142967 Transcript_62413/m.142967 type:complete len:496 (+) Transcript_62413:37-1524(+)